MNTQADSRSRIINAATVLFVENGLQSSMAAIAESAHVAMGSLYHHFPSKDGLVLEVCRHIAAAIEEGVVRPIDRSVPYQQRVEAYVRAYIEIIWSDANLAALYDYLTNSPAIERADLIEIFRTVTDHSIAVFSEAQEAGKDWGLSAQLAGSFIRGAVRNTLKRHRATGEPLTDLQRDRIVRMCWNALAP